MFLPNMCVCVCESVRERVGGWVCNQDCDEMAGLSNSVGNATRSMHFSPDSLGYIGTSLHKQTNVEIAVHLNHSMAGSLLM